MSWEKKFKKKVNSRMKSTKTITIKNAGGPSVIEYFEVALKKPEKDEVQIEHKAIGLNFIDIYHRSGVYPLTLPSGLGMEASGIVTDIGENVTHLEIGDRVVYAASQLGAYCQARTMPATQVCKLPNEISFEDAAAIMLKGLTVEYLFHRTTEINSDDTILFHAAAGGVGLIACQWAKSENIRLIGTAGSEEKCNLAIKNGASNMINYRKENFPEKVLELTKGQGVPIVMDSAGKDTFVGSIDCLQPLGIMISFGNSSGKVPPIDIGLLQSKGSLKLTRPTLFNPHLSSFEKCQRMANHLFEKVISKKIKVFIGQTFSFEDIPKAHEALQSGKTTGSTIIKV